MIVVPKIVVNQAEPDPASPGDFRAQATTCGDTYVGAAPTPALAQVRAVRKAMEENIPVVLLAVIGAAVPA